MRPASRQRTIYVNFAANQAVGTTVNFPDVQDLKDVIVEAVEAFTVDDISTSPQGIPGITAGDAVRCMVVLTDASTERIKEVPLLSLRSALYAGEVRQYDDLLLTLTQCYVKITATFVTAAASFVAFTITFRYRNDPAPKWAPGGRGSAAAAAGGRASDRLPPQRTKELIRRQRLPGGGRRVPRSL